MVLYLREVSSYLALVCVMREDHFAKRALLDYNIDCFRNSLADVFRETKPSVNGSSSSSSSSSSSGTTAPST